MAEDNKNTNNSSQPEVIVVETTAQDDSKTESLEKPKKKKGKLKGLLKSRKAHHGTVAIAIVAIVVVMVIVLNVIMSVLSDKFPNMALDLTANNSYALQDDTIDYVEHLSDTVNVKVLMTKSEFENNGTYFIQAEHLLEKMQSSSKGKLKLEYVDLTKNPTFTSKYSNVDWNATSSNYMILVESGDQYKALALDDCFEYDTSSGSYDFTGTKVEQGVITAILNITTKDKTEVDIIKGNQEQDYSAVKTLLENNAYSVKETSLATNGIGKDAKFVILFAPSVDLDESSVNKLSEWLDNNGKYGRSLIYIPCADEVDTPNIDSLLKDWGMQVNGGYVFETNTEHLISNSPYAFTVDYTDKYVDNLKNSKIPVAVTDTHNIKITDESKAHALLTTSDKSGVRPYDAKDDWNYEKAIEGKSLNVAVDGEKSNSDDKESSHIITFGSYTMFTSTIMNYNSFNNSSYLMNIFNTIANKDDTGITIKSKSLDNSELGLTDVATMSFMFTIFVIIVPVIVLVIGLIMWIRRRNK